MTEACSSPGPAMCVSPAATESAENAAAGAPRATFHLFPLLGYPLGLRTDLSRVGGSGRDFDTVIPGRYERPQIPSRSVQHSQRYFFFSPPFRASNF